MPFATVSISITMCVGQVPGGYFDRCGLRTQVPTKGSVEATAVPLITIRMSPREKQGDLNEAIREFQKAVDLSGGDPSYLAALAHAYALSGNQSQAQVICAKLQKRVATDYVSSYDIALVYLGLNRKQEALNWLNRAYEEDDPNMNFLNVDPTLDDLRSDRRFQNLLQRIGLVQ